LQAAWGHLELVGKGHYSTSRKTNGPTWGHLIGAVI
jgi:hypothetical protein